MAYKKLRRIVASAALVGACAVVPVLAGCNTSHPEAKITVEFRGTEYVLQYKMYRNMYPQTVQHFIELADNGFYENTIIHNYTTTAWYTGGYDYISEYPAGETVVEGKTYYEQAYAEGKESFRDYLEASSKEKEYAELAAPEAGKITPSVYKNFINGNYSQPLNTLIGEFSNNQHKIEKGALKTSYGCLTMYYSNKSGFDEVKNARIYMDKQGSPKGVIGEYKYNSATSLFSVRISKTETTSSDACVFAVLKNSEVLDDLTKAVSDYRTSIGSSKFSQSVNLYVDNYDEYIGANKNEVTYAATSSPIIIKSVKITKY